MNVGKSIAVVRKEHKMSQEQFGKLFFVTRQTVSSWENEKSYPDLQTLIEISDRFDISLDKLIKEDLSLVQTFDRGKRSIKIARIIIGILVGILLLLAGGMKFFSEAFEATSNGERNVSSTFTTMYMNFPDATPSRAIIRTFAKEEYDQFSERKRMKIRKDVRGSIEGDIPALHLEEDNKIYLVFQNTAYQNITLDESPKITITDLSGDGVMLPTSLETFEFDGGKITMVTPKVHKDDKGYYFENEFNYGDDVYDMERAVLINPCYIEVEYRFQNTKYISLSAYNKVYKAPGI